jgi:diphosphomevalonate decarboxylase
LRQLAGKPEFARVDSHNDFPTGAGLASSASGFAALVVAACAALKIQPDEQTCINIARSGSGSAPRSLFGGVVLLEPDAAAGEVSCSQFMTSDEWPLSVLVAVTSTAEKSVGSTDGMESSRLTSPYYDSWLETHPEDLRAGLECFEKRDFERLAELSERNCLKMHAVAMASEPALLYWSEGTMQCMQAVRDLRRAGVPVFFTIDAGPQLKAVCLPGSEAKVREALSVLPGVLQVMDSGLGEGARPLP